MRGKEEDVTSSSAGKERCEEREEEIKRRTNLQQRLHL